MNASPQGTDWTARIRLYRAVEGLVLGLTLAGVLVLTARVHLGADTWWHLRVGAWIWEHKRLPQVDWFSYTRYGTPWSPPGWPVQVLFYGLVRLAGYGALNVWTAIMVVLTYFLVVRSMRGGPYLRALALVLAALTGSLYQAARPYMVTTLLTAFFLWALETWARGYGERRLWMLVPAMVLWVHSHAGFLVGFLLWGVYFVESLVEAWCRPGRRTWRRVRRLGLLGVALVLASWLHPQGPGVWLYPWKTLGLERLTWIEEWKSPDFTRPETWPFLAWWFLMLLVLGTGSPSWRLRHGLLWMGFGLLGFRAVRNVALFSVVAPVVWTAYARPWWARWRKRLSEMLRRGAKSASRWRPFGSSTTPPVRPWVNRTLLLFAWVVALARLAAVSTPSAIASYVAQTFPQGPVTYLKEVHPEGRLFNSYNWGGYLLWALPEYPVFIDGRTDLYGDAYLRLWASVVTAEPGWQGVLDEYGVTIVMLEPHWPLSKVLPLAGWKEVYRDDHAVMFLRAQVFP